MTWPKYFLIGIPVAIVFVRYVIRTEVEDDDPMFLVAPQLTLMFIVAVVMWPAFLLFGGLYLFGRFLIAFLKPS